MRILCIIDTLLGMGGAEHSLYLLAREFERRGHKVIICCLKAGTLARQMREDGLYIIDLAVRRIYGLNAFMALYRVFRAIRQERVSVILSYHESSDYLAALIALVARIPIISSRRDMGFKLSQRHIWAYRFFNHLFDHISTVSSAVKEFIVKTQWTNPCNITVIPNGVDLVSRGNVGLDRLKGIEIEDGYFNICCIGNIRPIKGQKYLIEAAALIADRLPNVRFFLIGMYDHHNKAYYTNLKKQVRDLGLEKVVKFTGELDHLRVPQLLAVMDICASSSLSEGMSNAILEYMAAGKPVVATLVGGTSELVEEGKTGFLVRPRDPEAMAEALLKLLDSSELCHEMGLQGRSRIEAQFSVARMVDRCEDLLRYVCLVRKNGIRERVSVRFKELMRLGTSWGKVLTASIAYHSGAVNAFQWAKRVLRRGKVNILCFHDIAERGKNWKEFSIVIHPNALFRLLKFLKRHYQIVPLEEAVRLLERGGILRKDVFALSFDDCYKGWVKYVSPICEELRVPSTAFLAIEPLESGMPLLYDALVLMAVNTWRKVADLSRWNEGIFLLHSKGNMHCFVEEIHNRYRGKNKEDQDRFLRELSRYLDVPLDFPSLESLLLSWDDVRKIEASGIAMGAHSVTHRSLGDLHETDCFWEMSHSKHRLEEELGHLVDIFAYPYGASDHYRPSTIDVAKKVGFRNAFTLGTRNSDGFKPYEIGRRGVSSGMFSLPNGRFYEPLLATELSGLGDILFGRIFIRKRYRTELSSNMEPVSQKDL